jgi:hypothetical protein
MKVQKIIVVLLSKMLFILSTSNALAQLNFAPSSQHKCSYSENGRILVQGICTIYRNHNGYFYSIQWPDGVGTGIDRVSSQTVIIDKRKEAKLSWDKKVYYFEWENKIVVVDRFPGRK